MQIFQGIAVSPGFFVGEAFILDNEGSHIPRHFVRARATDDELKRLEASFQAVAEQIQQNQKDISAELGPEYGAIFAAHLQMLRDPKLNVELREILLERNLTAESAVKRIFGKYAVAFEQHKNRYFKERAHDVRDLERQLLNDLSGANRYDLANLKSPVIVLAHTLSPSETVRMDRGNVRGFATEIGGQSDHTAIVAEALEIPAVVGIGRLLANIASGDKILIDGDRGLVIHEPDLATLTRYDRESSFRDAQQQRLLQLRSEVAKTRDGTRINVMANIEFPDEAESCRERGADGIGLYRTEFLYLGTDRDPTEEDHFQAYIKVASALDPRPVVIRTLDLGADKMGRIARHAEHERNPFLGVRSIRLSLRNLSLFRTQLRAALRASALGNLRIMFPMISTLDELRQARLVLHEVMEDLDDQGIPFNRELKVGMMVEVPSAVVMLDRFIDEVEFISIGTNDLIQYALAVDRSNPEVSELYRASDPSVLRLIDQAINVASSRNVPANVCGQMCGNPLFTMLLIGMGLRSMSVRPGSLLQIKEVCRSVTLEQCVAVKENAMRMDSAREVERYLRMELRRAIPSIKAGDEYMD
ncbi:MAG: phosphoenolpyruvate--protein phosphotransferase [Planctomycetales bacterium]|nr:phosphoenolpyruvate--protein phosphotransferase [Planctomycetales bacterium]